MEFKNFPRFIGKSGKYEIHSPKLCAGIHLAKGDRDISTSNVPLMKLKSSRTIGSCRRVKSACRRSSAINDVRFLEEKIGRASKTKCSDPENRVASI